MDAAARARGSQRHGGGHQRGRGAANWARTSGRRCRCVSDAAAATRRCRHFRCRSSAVAEFPFELGDEATVAGTMATLDAACGGNADGRSRRDPGRLARRPGAGGSSRFAQRGPTCASPPTSRCSGGSSRAGFTYFRQISVGAHHRHGVVLALLHHGAAHRLGQPAAGRDCRAARAGLLARALVADVLSESALIVGIGGLLSLPLGLALALAARSASSSSMPGIPAAAALLRVPADALAVAPGAARRHGVDRRALSDAPRGHAADRGDAAQR